MFGIIVEPFKININAYDEKILKMKKKIIDLMR